MTEGKKRREWKSQAKPTSVLRKHDTFSPRLRRKCSVMTRLDLPSSGWPLSLARSSLILTNYIPDWQKIGSCRSVGPGTLASLALEERERDRETRYTTLKMTNTFIKKAKEHWSEKIDCMLASQGGTCKLIRNKKWVLFVHSRQFQVNNLAQFLHEKVAKTTNIMVLSCLKETHDLDQF